MIEIIPIIMVGFGFSFAFLSFVMCGGDMEVSCVGKCGAANGTALGVVIGIIGLFILVFVCNVGNIS